MTARRKENSFERDIIIEDLVDAVNELLKRRSAGLLTNAEDFRPFIMRALVTIDRRRADAAFEQPFTTSDMQQLHHAFVNQAKLNANHRSQGPAYAMLIDAAAQLLFTRYESIPSSQPITPAAATNSEQLAAAASAPAKETPLRERARRTTRTSRRKSTDGLTRVELANSLHAGILSPSYQALWEKLTNADNLEKMPDGNYRLNDGDLDVTLRPYQWGGKNLFALNPNDLDAVAEYFNTVRRPYGKVQSSHVAAAVTTPAPQDVIPVIEPVLKEPTPEAAPAVVGRSCSAIRADYETAWDRVAAAAQKKTVRNLVTLTGAQSSSPWLNVDTAKFVKNLKGTREIAKDLGIRANAAFDRIESLHGEFQTARNAETGHTR